MSKKYVNHLADYKPPESQKSLAKRIAKEAEAFRARKAAIPELRSKELIAIKAESRVAISKLYAETQQRISEHWAAYRAGTVSRNDAHAAANAVWEAYSESVAKIRNQCAERSASIRKKYRDLKRTPFTPSTKK